VNGPILADQQRPATRRVPSRHTAAAGTMPEPNSRGPITLVTGDERHLLYLKCHGTTRIVTTREAVALLNDGGNALKIPAFT